MAVQQVDSDKQSVQEDSSQTLSPKEGSTQGDGHEPEPPTLVYADGLRLAVIVISLLLSMFLVALDNTILSTAIPKITDEFQDLNKVSWYGAAYFMTFGGFQSTWGKFYKYFPIKRWFLVAMFIFEIGSLICGVAQNPTTLIVGRAIAGFGGGGIAVGVFTILGFAASPEKRPQVLGYSGATYGVAAVLGPLLGGAFTERVSWRWCFYINLPIGGLAAVIVVFFFRTPEHARPATGTRKEKLLQMDLVGAALMIGLIVQYILALQYGGQTHSWSSSVVIGLLVGFVVTVAAFVAWEMFLKERAMIVPRLFSKRYVLVGSLYMFCFGGGYFTILYYLPIYFQSVYNNSPIDSGVKMLALIIPLTFAAVAQGFVLYKVGIIPILWIIGGALGSIGCGLFYTMDANTSTGKWIGYQIIVGFTTGLTFQVALSNAQVHTPPEDMSQVTAIINCFLTIGGSFFLSAAQCAFNNQLIGTLASTIPDINPRVVLEIGATEIRQAFSADQIPLVINAYMVALRAVFGITIAAYGVATIIGPFGSWKKLRGEELKNATGGAA